MLTKQFVPIEDHAKKIAQLTVEMTLLDLRPVALRLKALGLDALSNTLKKAIEFLQPCALLTDYKKNIYITSQKHSDRNAKGTVTSH